MPLSRPIHFALEVVAGLFIAVAGATLAAKVGVKLNARANSEIRSAAAQERMAAAIERAAATPHHPKPDVCSQFETELARGACLVGAAQEFTRIEGQ